MEIETERLRLVACTLEVAESAMASVADAEKVLGTAIHADWLKDGLEDYLPIYVVNLSLEPDLYGWGFWMMLHKTDNLVIGDLGFKGKPENGIVDLGYKVVAPYRKQGYTTEAVQALIKWAFEQEGVTKVTAECLVGNFGSIGVLEKVGMTQLKAYFNEEEGGMMYKWELNK